MFPVKLSKKSGTKPLQIPLKPQKPEKLTISLQHGRDGAIYVSDIARQMHQPMPAISRGLRQMEQDGHIVRETDPKDRRKTLVRITPAGERARKANEQAMNDYFARIMARLTPEQLAQANAVKDALLAAIEAENAAMKTDLKGEPPHDENF